MTAIAADYNSLYVEGAAAAVGGLQTGNGAAARTNVLSSVRNGWNHQSRRIPVAQSAVGRSRHNGDFHLKSWGGRYLRGRVGERRVSSL
jgi:hypothetical protein